MAGVAVLENIWRALRVAAWVEVGGAALAAAGRARRDGAGSSADAARKRLASAGGFGVGSIFSRTATTGLVAKTRRRVLKVKIQVHRVHFAESEVEVQVVEGKKASACCC